MPWTAGRPLPRLWIHPAPARPLHSDLTLPTATLDAAGRLVLSEANRTGAELFALSSEWPGPEGPFDIAVADG